MSQHNNENNQFDTFSVCSNNGSVSGKIPNNANEASRQSPGENGSVHSADSPVDQQHEQRSDNGGHPLTQANLIAHNDHMQGQTCVTGRSDAGAGQYNSVMQKWLNDTDDHLKWFVANGGKKAELKAKSQK